MKTTTKLISALGLGLVVCSGTCLADIVTSADKTAEAIDAVANSYLDGDSAASTYYRARKFAARRATIIAAMSGLSKGTETAKDLAENLTLNQKELLCEGVQEKFQIALTVKGLRKFAATSKALSKPSEKAGLSLFVDAIGESYLADIGEITDLEESATNDLVNSVRKECDDLYESVRAKLDDQTPIADEAGPIATALAVVNGVKAAKDIFDNVFGKIGSYLDNRRRENALKKLFDENKNSITAIMTELSGAAKTRAKSTKFFAMVDYMLAYHAYSATLREIVDKPYKYGATEAVILKAENAVLISAAKFDNAFLSGDDAVIALLNKTLNKLFEAIEEGDKWSLDRLELELNSIKDIIEAVKEGAENFSEISFDAESEG